MPGPGEVNQQVGRAYLEVFVASLQASVPGFENKFTVYTEADKTSFNSRGGAEYSFDFNGTYFQPWGTCEVFGESKGYVRAGDLLKEFRAFLAKAYVTSTDHKRHRRDHFWFVTNVPFGCTEGSAVRSFEFVMAALADRGTEELRNILGSGHIDDGLVRDLLDRLGVFILTDSYLMRSALSYRVGSGDTLWNIVKRFHGGRVPAGFGSFAQRIATDNNLESPDRLRSGQWLKLPWCGMAG
jgi:nucleoid-associated protein YgaU